MLSYLQFFRKLLWHPISFANEYFAKNNTPPLFKKRTGQVSFRLALAFFFALLVLESLSLYQYYTVGISKWAPGKLLTSEEKDKIFIATLLILLSFAIGYWIYYLIVQKVCVAIGKKLITSLGATVDPQRAEGISRYLIASEWSQVILYWFLSSGLNNTRFIFYFWLIGIWGIVTLIRLYIRYKVIKQHSDAPPLATSLLYLLFVIILHLLVLLAVWALDLVLILYISSIRHPA